MTYTCPYCHQKMIHQPFNSTATKDENLIAQISDTFKCGCSINQVDSDDTIWFLNSWMLREDGWYHLGSTDGSVITEKFKYSELGKHKHDWVKVSETPESPFPEKVNFT